MKLLYIDVRTFKQMLLPETAYIGEISGTALWRRMNTSDNLLK